MAYTVNYSDDNKEPITVNDGTIDTKTNLTLVGKNFYGYGEYVAENQLHLLENFASESDSAPGEPESLIKGKPVIGQFWFNKTLNEMNIYKPTEAFPDGEWVPGPESIIMQMILTDSNNAPKDVTAIFDHGSLISVYSGHDDFILWQGIGVEVDENYVPGSPFKGTFPGDKIGKGVTLKAGSFFHGTATSAQYADLAEMYTSDAEYAPGTVIKIGGEAEVTQTTDAFCSEVFGIVSTNPAYLMNSTCEGTSVAVALEGRVPCRVIGPVRKGQRLVSSETPGVARAVSDYERQEALDWYRIVGRALADKTSEGEGLLEVVVGAK